MEFKVVNEQLPVIMFNFEELKTALAETMKKYAGAVVTEENLQGCKATQKELAGIRTKIDRYRIDKKKELSKPIAEFEAQCKELIGLVEKAEEPIKEGIKVFDDKARESKRLFAQDSINKAVESQQLNDKYASQLNVLDKYTNLTAKHKDVLEDIEIRATELKESQNNELEMLEIIKDTIENANKNINAKLSLVDFQMLIDQGVSTKEIMQEINSRADRIKEAEVKAEELRIKKEKETAELKAKKELEAKQAEEERLRITALPKEEPIAEVVEDIKPVEEIPVCKGLEETFDELISEKAKQYFVEIRITGPAEDTRKVGNFLRDNNISYAMLKSGEID